ncbi:hypothetical protein Ciccas_002958 [Cichlidogyrus casuarinus]|uniref:Uncharacterized protein n=1 Tax=Cichlidogyrus casuarinus TaxID=1844966 RepID=A0ABD2QFS8_9PLAT
MSSRRKSSKLFSAIDRRLSGSSKKLDSEEEQHKISSNQSQIQRIEEKCDGLEKQLSFYNAFHNTVDTRLHNMLELFQEYFKPEDLEIGSAQDRGALTIKTIEHINWLIRVLLCKLPKASPEEVSVKAIKEMHKPDSPKEEPKKYPPSSTKLAVVIQSSSEKDSDEATNLSPIAEINSEDADEDIVRVSPTEASYRRKSDAEAEIKHSLKDCNQHSSRSSISDVTDDKVLTSRPDTTSMNIPDMKTSTMSDQDYSVILNHRPCSHASSIMSEKIIQEASPDNTSMVSVSSSNDSFERLHHSKWTIFFVSVALLICFGYTAFMPARRKERRGCLGDGDGRNAFSFDLPGVGRV